MQRPPKSNKEDTSGKGSNEEPASRGSFFSPPSIFRTMRRLWEGDILSITDSKQSNTSKKHVFFSEVKAPRIKAIKTRRTAQDDTILGRQPSPRSNIFNSFETTPINSSFSKLKQATQQPQALATENHQQIEINKSHDSKVLLKDALQTLEQENEASLQKLKSDIEKELKANEFQVAPAEYFGLLAKRRRFFDSNDGRRKRMNYGAEQHLTYLMFFLKCFTSPLDLDEKATRSLNAF